MTQPRLIEAESRAWLAEPALQVKCAGSPQTTQSVVGMPGPLIDFFKLKPGWVIALVVVLALVPFITKPVNIDDPLFVWAAQHILVHPSNPYGFNVNWYDSMAPMWLVTENPPLACYYLAAGAAIIGWSEIALHTMFLLPAIAVILGTHRLARRFCFRPMLAAIITLFTPVFMVSSNTLMCDVLMLAFWIWSVIFWLEGMEQKDRRLLAVAALLITFASLTKYFGICLIPLLVAWSAIARHRFKDWLIWLFIPVVIFAAYQVVMRVSVRALPFSKCSELRTVPAQPNQY